MIMNGRFSRLRAKLGSVKKAVLDEWPYASKHNCVPAMRASLDSLAASLQQLPEVKKADYEIHMLCGRRDVGMGIMASWSIMRFMAGRCALYVHSDGTLDERDAAKWSSIVGGITIVERTRADEVIRQHLAGNAPKLYAWRCSNWASAQLVDVHFFGNAPRMLVMDSDVLVFSRPDEVLRALDGPESCFAWCSDLRECYSADRQLLTEVCGIEPARRLCAGFLVSPRLLMDDFRTLELHIESISSDGRVEIDHFWSCQTYYALMAGESPGSRIFGDAYSNTSGKTHDRQKLRHYVGIPKVRFRYFTEGIPRVLCNKRDRTAVASCDNPSPPLLTD